MGMMIYDTRRLNNDICIPHAFGIDWDDSDIRCWRTLNNYSYRVSMIELYLVQYVSASRGTSTATA